MDDQIYTTDDLSMERIVERGTHSYNRIHMRRDKKIREVIKRKKNNVNDQMNGNGHYTNGNGHFKLEDEMKVYTDATPNQEKATEDQKWFAEVKTYADRLNIDVSDAAYGIDTLDPFPNLMNFAYFLSKSRDQDFKQSVDDARSIALFEEERPEEVHTYKKLVGFAEKEEKDIVNIINAFADYMETFKPGVENNTSDYNGNGHKEILISDLSPAERKEVRLQLYGSGLAEDSYDDRTADLESRTA